MIQKRPTATGEMRYLVRLFRGRDPVTGKKQYSFQTLPTRKEAQRWEREQKHALDRGAFVEPSTETLGAFLAEWLRSRTKLAPQTLAGYRKLVTSYVLRSDLAAVPLARLATKRLETFYRSLSERSLSPRTVRLVHSILHAALKTATRDRLIVSNP